MNNFSLLKKAALFCCILSFWTLNSQNLPPTISNTPTGSYVPGEVLILFESGLTSTEKQATRDYYQVIDFTTIAGRVELWTIPLPMTIDDNGTPVTLQNEFDFLNFIHNNTGGSQNNGNGNSGNSSQATNRGHVNGGDYNYVIEDSNPLTGPPVVYNDPLLACTTSNPNLYGTTGTNTNLPTIVLIDQAMTMETANLQVYFTSTTPQYPLGVATHGDKMAFLINEINTTNGLSPEIINLVIFDETGQATYADFLRALYWLEENNYSNLIINLSASAQLDEIGLNSQAVLNYINESLITTNSILVTSAGNDGQGEHETAILPGGAIMSNEITVAGTRDCFTTGWGDSNRNPARFEIAAEAHEILAPYSSTGWMVSSGTSFSTCQVTAALTQIASHNISDAGLMRQRLLSTATQVSALDDYCQDGRVLNATAATSLGSGTNLGLTAQNNDSSSQLNTGSSVNNFLVTDELSIQVSPNPTQDEFTLRWNSATTSPAILEVYNELGQRLSRQELGSHSQNTSLSLRQLAANQAGIYFLRIQQNDQVVTKRIILR